MITRRKIVKADLGNQVLVQSTLSAENTIASDEYQSALSDLKTGTDVLKNLLKLEKLLRKRDPSNELHRALLTLSNSADATVQNALATVIASILTRGIVSSELLEFMVLQAERSKIGKVRQIVLNALGEAVHYKQQQISDKALSSFFNVVLHYFSKKTFPSEQEKIINIISFLARKEEQKRLSKYSKIIIDFAVKFINLCPEQTNSSLWNKLTKIGVEFMPQVPQKYFKACSKVLIESLYSSEKKEKWAKAIVKSLVETCPVLFTRIVSEIAQETVSKISLEAPRLSDEMLECFGNLLLQSQWKHQLRDEVLVILRNNQSKATSTLQHALKAIISMEAIATQKEKLSASSLQTLLQNLKNAGKLTYRASLALKEIVTGRKITLNSQQFSNLLNLIVEILGFSVNSKQCLDNGIAKKLCSLYQEGLIKLSGDFLKIIEAAQLDSNSLMKLEEAYHSLPQQETDKLLSLDLLLILSVTHHHHFEVHTIIKLSISYLIRMNPYALKKYLGKVLTIIEHIFDYQSDFQMPTYAAKKLLKAASLPELLSEYGERAYKLLVRIKDAQGRDEHPCFEYLSKHLRKLQNKIEEAAKSNLKTFSGFSQRRNSEMIMIEEKKTEIDELRAHILNEFFSQSTTTKEFKPLIDELVFYFLSNSSEKSKDPLTFQLFEGTIKTTKQDSKHLKKNYISYSRSQQIVAARCLSLLLEGVTINAIDPWWNDAKSIALFEDTLRNLLPGSEDAIKEIVKRMANSTDWAKQLECIKALLFLIEFDQYSEIIQHIMRLICSGQVDFGAWCKEIVYCLLKNIIPWSKESDYSLFVLTVIDLEIKNDYQENDLRMDRLLVLLMRRLTLNSNSQYSSIQVIEIIQMLQIGPQLAEESLLMGQGDNWITKLRQNFCRYALEKTKNNSKPASGGSEELLIKHFGEILGPKYLNWSISCCKEFFETFQKYEITELLDCLKLVDDLKVTESEFQAHFLKSKHSTPKIHPQSQKGNASGALLQELQTNLLIHSLEQSLKAKGLDVNSSWRRLIADCEWSLDNSLSLLKVISSKCENLQSSSNTQIKKLIAEVVQLLVDYKITWKKELIEIMTNHTIKKWEDEIFKVLAFKSDLQEKSYQTLLDELQKVNPQIKFTKNDLEGLKDDYATTVAKSEDSVGSIMNCIRDWAKEQVLEWRNNIFNKKKTPISEVLAVVRQACSLHCQRKPRAAQILAILMLWRGDKYSRNSNQSIMIEEETKRRKGRLAQINTGEGKSLTIAAFAVVLSLYGSKVDIITSSYQLAQRDQSEWSGLYTLFGLTSSHNTDDRTSESVTEKDPRCYNSDIVYGNVGAFQYDYLSQVYYGKNTRGKRPFDVALVDEVDSMLLDEGSKSALLSSPCPGFSFLQPLLVAIWYKVNDIESKYFLSEELDNALCWGFNLNSEEGAVEEIYKVEDKDEFTKDRVKSYVQFLIDKTDSELYVPKHLKKLALNQINTWVESALMALRMKEHCDYIITKSSDGARNEVVPVDFKLTGVVQVGMVWQNGLQQFVQMKHKIEITSESLSSCFISNVSYFQKYSQLFGLTGTLGPKDSQSLLADTYSIDIFIQPTYKPKQFIELPLTVIRDGQEAWKTAICTAAAKEIRRGRCLLILCQTIEDSSELRKVLVPAVIPQDKCTTYDRDDVDKSKIDGLQMGIGHVLIATNLAGRGVDLKIPDLVENNGGLHVILTFLPSNYRVEMQAFGRTARQGKKGSGQLIVDAQRTFDGLAASEEEEGLDVKLRRDILESARLYQVRNVELPLTLIKDKLFDNFIKLVCSFRGSGPLKKNYFIDAVEERWAIFLKCLEGKLEEKINAQVSAKELEAFALEQYASFSNDISLDSFTTREHVTNPLYFILHGCQQVSQNDDASGWKAAIDSYNSALSFGDSIYAFAAHYNRAYARIKNREANYKRLACEDLKATKAQIENSIIPGLESMLVLLSMCPNPEPVQQNTSKPEGRMEEEKKEGDNVNKGEQQKKQIELNECDQQVQFKINLLRECVVYIDQAVSTINHCQEENDITVKICNPLNKVEGDKSLDPNYLNDIHLVGIQMLFEVQERPPPCCWWSVIGLALLATAQIVAGGLLTAFGAPTFGTALIGEGLSDAFQAISSAVKGEKINWKQYAVQKAISVTITIATMGIGAIKQGLSVAKQGLSVAKHGIKQVFSKVPCEILIKKGMSTMTKEGLKLAIKQVATEGIKFCAKKILEKGLEKLTKYALDRLVNQFKEKLGSSLRERLSSGKFSELATIILCLSSIPRSTEGQVKLSEVIHEVLKSDKESNSLLGKFASQITDGILQDGLGKAVGTVWTLTKIGLGVAEAAILSNKVGNQLEAAIEVSKETAWREKIQCWQKDLEPILGKNGASLLVQKLKYGEKITKQTLEACCPELGANKLQEGWKYVERKINATFDFKSFNLENIVQDIEKAYLDKFSSIVHGKIIAPCNQLATKKIMGAVFNKMNKKHDQKLKNFAEGCNIRRQVNKDANRAAKNKASGAAKPSSDKIQAEPSEKVKALIDSTSSTGQGGLENLGALSAATTARIDVYIDGKRYTSVGDAHSGEPVALSYDPVNKHWSLLDKNLDPVPSGTNNCLYDAVGAQKNMSGRDLRNAAAQHIQNNPGSYDKICSFKDRMSGTDYLLHGGGWVRTKMDMRGHNGKAIPNIKDKVKENMFELIDGIRDSDFSGDLGKPHPIVPRSGSTDQRVDQQNGSSDGLVNIQAQVHHDTIGQVTAPADHVFKDKNRLQSFRKQVRAGLKHSINIRKRIHLEWVDDKETKKKR